MERLLDEVAVLIILSALVVHTAWHWMLTRGEILAKFPLPALDAAFMASLMRGATAALILAAGVWAVNAWVSGRPPAEDP